MWKGWQGEICTPLSISIGASFPQSVSGLALSLDEGLTLGLVASRSCRGVLRFSRRRARWLKAMWVYLPGDAACHSIPLSSGQHRPWGLCSFPVLRIKCGRLYHGRGAHKTYFQDEWKPYPFFLLHPFLFLLCLFMSTWHVSRPFLSIFKILKCPLKCPWHPLGGKHTTALFFFFLEALLKNNPLLSSDGQDSVICTYNLIL